MRKKQDCCNKCGQCCHGMENNTKKRIVVIFPSEARIISNYLSLQPDDFLKDFCFFERYSISGYIINIAFLKSASGHCIFLNNRNLCDIFLFRPIQCRYSSKSIFSEQSVWLSCKVTSTLNNKHQTIASDDTLISELIKGYPL